MKKWLMIWTMLLLVSLTTLSFAQSKITVTGVIQDTGGNVATSGTVTFTLMPQNNAIQYSVAGQGVIAPIINTCGIDGSGNVKNVALSGACQVWGNDVISPGGTTYTVTTSPNGVQGPTSAYQLITGAGPYDLTRPVFGGPFKVQPQYSTIFATPFTSNLLPAVSGGVNIGTVSLPWGSVFTNNLFYQTLGGTTRTVANLPSASSSKGVIIVVSDSTAVASEGQTCVGSSTNTALAFSNGTVWKCF